MTSSPDGSSSVRRMSVEWGADGPWLTVALGGELDVVTAPALLDQVGLLIAQETPPRIALELSQLSGCDSSGINAFVRLWKRAGAAGGELVLLRPPARVAELLNRVGLDGHLRVCARLPAVSGAGPDLDPV
ncbi:STAS domain-containing protein [Actinomadura geliboluensis]|uniref:STAS domain-containing protein n=1 Tax=Actinomadura geliboluensis TaxID=882440 RepID=A0A5S4G7Y5_9ACTN|nr:STAS domain-containing protein [Actinomadura geliboluensis]TMR28959.1 STAS domain-containing protein [Actinomadura geliboluensis]